MPTSLIRTRSSDDGGSHLGCQAAQDFVIDERCERNPRYEVVDEYISLVIKPWESWDGDAVVINADTDDSVHDAKVWTIHSRPGSTTVSLFEF